MSADVITTDAVDPRRDRRTARLLLHRSRSLWLSITLLVAMALAIVAIVESVLWALGLPPAIIDPSLVRAVFTEGGLWGGVVAAVALILGLVCFWGALAPGRTHRRIVGTDRAPIVVDDDIIAGALSRSAAGAAGVGGAQVTTRMSGRRAVTSVTPSSGFAVDTDAVTRAGDDLLHAVGMGSAMTARVTLSSKGTLS